ncbi:MULTISPECIES: hypothetical protein [Corynebacterium]|nr:MULTISPECIES: hypothetical protein [Corynebacterium]
MNTKEFHEVSMLFALLRKFYGGDDAVRIGAVIESMLKELPGSEHTLRSNLKRKQHEYREYIELSAVDVDPSTRRPEDIMYDITYGLLIHSDPERQASLLKSQRAYVHLVAVLNKGNEPVIELLRTIQRARKEGTLKLPAPHEAIWEPSTPTLYTAEEIDEIIMGTATREVQDPTEK